MQQLEQHIMQLEETHPSGAEEWSCPTCGRRFLVQWPPSYKKIVLDSGDESASHSGGKGGVLVGTPQMATNGQTAEPMLAQVWLDVIENMDLSSLPDDLD